MTEEGPPVPSGRASRDAGSMTSAPATGSVALPRAIGPGNVLRVYHESMASPTADEVAAAQAGMTIVLTFRLSPPRGDGGRRARPADA